MPTPFPFGHPLRTVPLHGTTRVCMKNLHAGTGIPQIPSSVHCALHTSRHTRLRVVQPTLAFRSRRRHGTQRSRAACFAAGDELADTVMALSEPEPSIDAEVLAVQTKVGGSLLRMPMIALSPSHTHTHTHHKSHFHCFSPTCSRLVWCELPLSYTSLFLFRFRFHRSLSLSLTRAHCPHSACRGSHGTPW
jgi:hypothetical protein